MQAKFGSLWAALGLAKRQAAHSREAQGRELSRTASADVLRGRHSADPRGRTNQQPRPAPLMRSQSRTRKEPAQSAAGLVKPLAGLLFRNRHSQPIDRKCQEVGLSSSHP